MGLAPVNLKYLIKTFAEPNQVILMCTFNNTANEIECKVQRVPPGSLSGDFGCPKSIFVCLFRQILIIISFN